MTKTRRNEKDNEAKKMEGKKKVKFPILFFAGWRESTLYPGE